MQEIKGKARFAPEDFKKDSLRGMIAPRILNLCTRLSE
jgi:hypothetical protein